MIRKKPTRSYAQKIVSKSSRNNERSKELTKIAGGLPILVTNLTYSAKRKNPYFPLKAKAYVSRRGITIDSSLSRSKQVAVLRSAIGLSKKMKIGETKYIP